MITQATDLQDAQDLTFSSDSGQSNIPVDGHFISLSADS